MSLRIKSSTFSIKFANVGKRVLVRDFLSEYTNAVNFYVSYLWQSRIEWNLGDTKQVLDVAAGEYNTPKFISTVDIQYGTNLSARALKRASSEACGIVKSITEKLLKLEQKVYLANLSGDANRIRMATDKFSKMKFQCPVRTTKFATLDTLCCEFVQPDDSSFDGFLLLKSIGKDYGKIPLPVKFHRHANKLTNDGWVRKTTWMVYEDRLVCTFEKEAPPKKQSGKKVGLDQGAVTAVTLSDGQVTGKDLHGHDLRSIMHKLSRCKKGSNGYRKAQDHRKNYINWAVNRLNLDDVAEIGFEKVRHIKASSNFLSKWAFKTIESAIESRCEDEGVLLSKQSSVYRSQRCSDCGFVHKGNRKAKVFKCRHCGTVKDADLNGALNHEVEIPPFPFSLWHLKLNTIGFFWNSDGLVGLDGEEITVPPTNKT